MDASVRPPAVLGRRVGRRYNALDRRVEIIGMRAAAHSPACSFVLNGRAAALDAAPPGLTLLDYLRGQGLTGAKEGCAEGECGACAVALVTPRGRESRYQAVNSCLVPAALVDGCEVVTVEGLAAGGRLADAQAALAASGGSQCGYCTPGFVISLFVEQYRPGRQGPCDIRALGGNLCRCTGYRPIRDAAAALGPPPPGPLLDRLARPAPRLDAVSRPDFTRPTSVQDCLAALAAYPDATLVAGATDVGVDVNLKAFRASHLVSLDAVEELTAFTESDDRIRIGAALPLTDLESRWTAAPAAVAEWLDRFASPLIRNRATLGGNLATASPIGDAAPLLLALDADVEIAGPSARRLVPLSEFFTGYRQTRLERGELLTAVEISKPLPAALRFYKVAKRRSDDISTVAAAIALDRAPDGAVTRLRLAFGGVAATPIRVEAAEAVAVGARWSDTVVDRVCDAIGRTLQPLSDHRGSREFRLAVAANLVRKFQAELRA